jgi:hypothetical protein
MTSPVLGACAAVLDYWTLKAFECLIEWGDELRNLLGLANGELTGTWSGISGGCGEEIH